MFDWRSAEWTVDLWELSVITFIFTSSHHLPSSSQTLVMNCITVSLFICLLVCYYRADVRSALERHVLDCSCVLSRGTKWSCGGISGTKFIHTQLKEEGDTGVEEVVTPSISLLQPLDQWLNLIRQWILGVDLTSHSSGRTPKNPNFAVFPGYAVKLFQREVLNWVGRQTRVRRWIHVV